MFIYDAAMKYMEEGTTLMVVGGKDYGMGSSRDWAAKGTLLLGVKAVLVESFERIHRSNLIGMGVLPLLFEDGKNLESYGLDGTETFDVPVGDDLNPNQSLTVLATPANGESVEIPVVVALNTPVEVEYYRHGGILNYVLRDYLSNAPEPA